MSCNSLEFTNLQRIFQPYGKQPIELHSILVDWFLPDSNIRH